jgi:hypothetical protein
MDWPSGEAKKVSGREAKFSAWAPRKAAGELGARPGEGLVAGVVDWARAGVIRDKETTRDGDKKRGRKRVMRQVLF